MNRFFVFGMKWSCLDTWECDTYSLWLLNGSTFASSGLRRVLYFVLKIAIFGAAKYFLNACTGCKAAFHSREVTLLDELSFQPVASTPSVTYGGLSDASEINWLSQIWGFPFHSRKISNASKSTMFGVVLAPACKCETGFCTMAQKRLSPERVFTVTLCKDNP